MTDKALHDSPRAANAAAGDAPAAELADMPITQLLAGPARMALGWVRAFWILGAVLLLGLWRFGGPIERSIASTPHPELVYAIFLTAAAAAVMLGGALHELLVERRWFDEMRARSRPEQDEMIADRAPGKEMNALYRVFVQTRGLPLAVRQPALEDELASVEAQFIARQALPNLLSGSLVGLGLVGTFIGLLQTLGDLSGVFAALGNGAAGDGDGSAAVFSTMIVKLQGPMQGMGTAFVASLYGLLGSLVMGLTVSAVRREGERLITAVRSFVNDDVYPSSAVAVLGIQPAADGKSQPLSIDQWAQLFAVIREEHRSMRDLFIQWEGSFSKRFDQLANVASSLNHQLVETVDFVGEQAEMNAKRIEEVSTMEGRLAQSLDEKGTQVVEQIDSFRKDLTVARHSVLPVFGRSALVLAVLGALAGLAALALSFKGPLSAPKMGSKEVSTASSSGPKPMPKTNDLAAPPPVTVRVTPPPKLPDSAKAGTVEVRAGESLYTIAGRLGVSLDQLEAANPQVKDPRRMMPGTRLNLPPKASVKMRPQL